MPEHILFLTGKLAEHGLQRVLASLEPCPFTYEVLNIGVSVAALMSAEMIGRRLQDPRGAGRIIVPGLCAGDLAATGQGLGVPVERGPEDLTDLPEYFGRNGRPADLSRYRIQIFAEIVDAPRLAVEAILARAARYKRDGADVIDLGGLPGVAFPHLAEAVAALHEAGHRVSVDTLDSKELRRGGEAGADYLLSLTESTLPLAEGITSVPVLIPAQPGDLDSLCRAVDRMGSLGKPFLADSILDPIHFGFTESVLRYRELRRRYPSIEIMMGTGNLSELTDADTAGLNAVLAGIMSELDIHYLLTTEVSPHARSVVRELDFARRALWAARQDHSLPRGYGGGLLAVHERRPFPYRPEEIAEMAATIRDPSLRVQVSEAGIHVYNRDGMRIGRDPFELFPQLQTLENDAPHAFYMGVELARAEIAWQLGKRYAQDQPLKWGSAYQPEPAGASDRHGYKVAGTTVSAHRSKLK